MDDLLGVDAVRGEKDEGWNSGLREDCCGLELEGVMVEVEVAMMMDRGFGRSCKRHRGICVRDFIGFNLQTPLRALECSLFIHPLAHLPRCGSASSCQLVMEPLASNNGMMLIH